MRYEVPQFTDIEDKIFGPLTWRQFVYLGGGLGLPTVLFLTMPFVVTLVIGVPLALLGLALAFYPVNNRPFSYFLEAVWQYATKDRLYKWGKKKDVVYKQTTATAPTIKPHQRGSSHPNITSLTRSLELQALQNQN